jgi:hypothetical protein
MPNRHLPINNFDKVRMSRSVPRSREVKHRQKNLKKILVAPEIPMQVRINQE